MIRIILALLIPWLVFFTIGRPIAGIICLLLQAIGIFGALFTFGIPWGIATIWALWAVIQYNTDQKIKDATGN